MALLYRLKSLPFRIKFSLVASALLIFGLASVIIVSRQQQEIRSRASTDINGDYQGNLIGDDFRVAGAVLGNIIGNRNQVSNGVQGSIYGNDNSIYGNVTGCINGNNNRIAGSVTGGVVGTNNIVTGTKGTGDCPLPGSSTPIPTPTPSTISCPAPANFTGAAGSGNNWNYAWSPSANAASYKIYYGSRSPIFYAGPFVTNSGVASALNPGSTYNFYVRATCSGIESANSNIFTVTFPAAIPTPTPTNTLPPPSPTPSPTPISPTSTPIPTVTPTPMITVTPASTTIALKLLLHGLGKGGDTANPNGGGNPNPRRPQRSVTVEILNSQNQLVLTKQGTITFNSSAGNFTGQVDLGSTLATGAYTVKVKTPQFLRTLVPGIQNLTAGTSNQLPVTILVNGDINGDNTLNILDYNILMGCYSDFLPPTSCTNENKILTDLDDDGVTNQFDYNLFLRELTNREGQ
jgi:hypothetical protein